MSDGIRDTMGAKRWEIRVRPFRKVLARIINGYRRYLVAFKDYETLVGLCIDVSDRRKLLVLFRVDEQRTVEAFVYSENFANDSQLSFRELCVRTCECSNSFIGIYYDPNSVFFLSPSLREQCFANRLHVAATRSLSTIIVTLEITNNSVCLCTFTSTAYR